MYTWLSASLAAEVGLVVNDGSKLGIDLEIAEGAVLYYGADDVGEAELLPALSGLVQTMMGFGGVAEFDLAELLGAGSQASAGIPLADLSIQILTHNNYMMLMVRKSTACMPFQWIFGRPNREKWRFT